MNVGQSIDLFFIILLVIGLIHGWIIGLAGKAGNLIALVLAIITAYVAAQVFGDIFFSKVGLFLIIYVIGRLIYGQIVRILNIVEHIPVVKTLNRIGGAVLGFMMEAVFIYVLCIAVFSLPDAVIKGFGLTDEVIQSTSLLKYLIGRG